MRQALGASGAALLAPGAIIGALVALALGGGFGGLGTLGQIFTGPSQPLSGATRTSEPSSHHSPAGASAGGRAGRSPRLVSGRAAAHGSVPAGVGSAPSPGEPARSPGVPVGQPGGPAVAAAPSPGQSTPTSAPGPGPRPSAIDRVVAIGTSVTGRLPGPAGPAVTQAVQAVGASADRLIGPHSSDATTLDLP